MRGRNWALKAFLRCLALYLVTAVGAHAADRIALVVGNGEYTAVPGLSNPVSDAKLMTESLQAVGFEVMTVLNSDQSELKRAIVKFGRALREAGPDATGLFYYAGHGVQSYGTNYLLPVDVELTNQADLDLVAVEAQSVLRQMFSARNKTNIVILDACRNNPFESVRGFRDNGLAEMQAPTGTFLAYATAPGAVASDGAQGNSPFTAALASSITEPGVPIEKMFKNVRVNVIEETGGLQTPWDTSSLTNDFSFVERARLTPEEVEQRQLFESLQSSRDPVQIMLFLRAYPQSDLVAPARALLAEVMEEELAKGSVEDTEPEQPAQAELDDADQKLFESSQQIGTIEAYQEYLAAFPEGTFAEFAKVEIAALSAKTDKDPLSDGQPVQEQVAAVQAPTPAPAPQNTPVAFDVALSDGGAAVIGRTLEELSKGSPIYPPIEGIPDELWKNQSCSNCHQWTRVRLCTQANVYLNKPATRAVTLLHPYGGGFKQNLRSWAAGGCK